MPSDKILHALDLCSLPPVVVSSFDSMYFSLSSDREDIRDLASAVIAQTQKDVIIDKEEIEKAKEIVKYLRLMNVETSSEALTLQKMHQIAFGDDHTLGREPTDAEIDAINVQHIKDVQDNFFVADNMVVSAMGVDHNEFIDMNRSMLEAIPSSRKNPIIVPPLEYKGGLFTLLDTSDETRKINRIAPNEDYRSQAHVAIAWKSFPLNTREFYVSAVLDSLLGSGASFSTGGPGKGMFSYLSDIVMNQHHFFHNVRALHEATFMHGMFGLFCTIKEGRFLINALEILIEAMGDMSRLKDEVAFLRAKNILKQKILTTLELSDYLNEENAKQLLLFGKTHSLVELCLIVDSITLDEVRSFCKQIILSDPCIVLTAKEEKFLSKVPSYSSICKATRSVI